MKKRLIEGLGILTIFIYPLFVFIVLFIAALLYMPFKIFKINTIKFSHNMMDKVDITLDKLFFKHLQK